VKISLQSLKKLFEAQNQYDRVIYRLGILHEEIKNMPNRIEKAEISLQSPKTELSPQNIKNKFPH
jgi:hypothetical protein